MVVLLVAHPSAAALEGRGAQAVPPEAALQQTRGATAETPPGLEQELIRLPLAAALAAVLAFRPRRRGTPPRQPAVIQTQIILGVVGAVVMIVVGSNLARAFGVVGAAGLVRYRAKIEDPKDAGVMLSTLAVGLAAGVGLYGMAVFAAAFILVVLWAVESFEPQRGKRFEVTIKAGADTDERRPDIERIFRRYEVPFELRTTSDEEVCYDVTVPFTLETDRLSNAILKLDPKGHTAVEWTEKKTK
jgi:hypothetical protein